MTTLNDLTTDLTAVIYTRKSTASDGKSTRDQERECREWCDRNNIPIEEVFCDEGISASKYTTKKRGAWAELKAYLQPGHILVVWESSRATRDLGEWAALNSLCASQGVPLAYSGRVLDLTLSDDAFMGGLDALQSARESHKISERTRRGMRGAAIDGTPHGRPPWGYRRKDTIHPEWEPDPIEAPRVREAVERVLGGESRKSVLRWLQSTGYAPASLGSFTRLLTNPQLAGLRVHQGKVFGGASWPALITEAQHHQLVAASKAGTVTPGTESKHLCSGLVKCGKCGKGLRFKTVAKGRKPLYACPSGCASRLAEVIDREVTKAVMRRLENVNPKDYSGESPEVASALRQIEQLETDLADWEEKAVSGEVSASTFAKVEKDRKAKIKALRPRTVPARLDLLRPEGWEGGTLQQRRTAIRVLLDVTVPPRGKRGHIDVPGVIDITPK
jgi:site-specific DNA recombinase